MSPENCPRTDSRQLSFYRDACPGRGRVEARSVHAVRVGSYARCSTVAPIYGRDFGTPGGDPQRGLQSFFDTFDEKSYAARLLSGEQAAERRVLPQLRERVSTRLAGWLLYAGLVTVRMPRSATGGPQPDQGASSSPKTRRDSCGNTSRRMRLVVAS